MRGWSLWMDTAAHPKPGHQPPSRGTTSPSCSDGNVATRPRFTNQLQKKAQEPKHRHTPAHSCTCFTATCSGRHGASLPQPRMEDLESPGIHPGVLGVPPDAMHGHFCLHTHHTLIQAHAMTIPTCPAEPSRRQSRVKLWLTQGDAHSGIGVGDIPTLSKRHQGLPGRLGLLQNPPNPGESTRRNSLKKCKGHPRFGFPPPRSCPSSQLEKFPGEPAASTFRSSFSLGMAAAPFPGQLQPHGVDPSSQPSTRTREEMEQAAPHSNPNPPHPNPNLPPLLPSAFAPCLSPFSHLWQFPARVQPHSEHSIPISNLLAQFLKELVLLGEAIAGDGGHSEGLEMLPPQCRVWDKLLSSRSLPLRVLLGLSPRRGK